MFHSPAASASASPARPIRTMGLTVNVPEKPNLATVVASIKRQDQNITLPDLSPNSRNMPVLLDAFSTLPNGSDITLYVNQFATNPHEEPREHLIQLWNEVKHKVKRIIWDQNRFFKSFVAELSDELKHDSSVARCEFPIPLSMCQIWKPDHSLASEQPP